MHHPENPKHYRRSDLRKFFTILPPTIKAENVKTFANHFNDNIVSKNFLETCKKAGKLFGKKK